MLFSRICIVCGFANPMTMRCMASFMIIKWTSVYNYVCVHSCVYSNVYYYGKTRPTLLCSRCYSMNILYAVNVIIIREISCERVVNKIYYYLIYNKIYTLAMHRFELILFLFFQLQATSSLVVEMTNAVTKFLLHSIASDAYASLGLMYPKVIVPDGQYDAAGVYSNLRRRVEFFDRKHGADFDQMLHDVKLTDINIKCQYFSGIKGIFRAFGDEMTKDAPLSVFVYFNAVLKQCLKRDMINSTNSLIGWTLNVFAEHNDSICLFGGWNELFKN